jgi:TolB-like protein/tetratricopeptide (TPR) repeat protein
MTEEMIARLGRLHPQRLGVIARASAIRYKNSDKDVDQIGRELGADYVLKGTAHGVGHRIQIGAELIQVEDRTQLWADRFEGNWAEVEAIHIEVVRHIARALQVELLPAMHEAVAATSTSSPEAHTAFLRGRYCLNKGTAEGVRSAISHFEEATSRDSRYAEAHAGLAVALDLADHFRVFPGRQAFPKAKASANTALELNDALPEAHNALAFAKHSLDWDWEGAERVYKRAIALNPNFATARHWHGFYLGMLGRTDEALAELRRAQVLNPLAIIVRTHLGLMLYQARRYDEAMEQLRQTLEMEPDFAAAHYFLASTYEQKGLYEETVTHLERALTVSPGSPDKVGALGHAHGVFNRRGRARETLKQLHELSQRRFVSAYDFAIVFVGLGEVEQAFEWLEKACEERSFSMLMSLKSEPRLDPLRSDPRYQRLLRRVGLLP